MSSAIVFPIVVDIVSSEGEVEEPTSASSVVMNPSVVVDRLLSVVRFPISIFDVVSKSTFSVVFGTDVDCSVVCCEIIVVVSSSTPKLKEVPVFTGSSVVSISSLDVVIYWSADDISLDTTVLVPSCVVVGSLMVVVSSTESPVTSEGVVVEAETATRVDKTQ